MSGKTRHAGGAGEIALNRGLIANMADMIELVEGEARQVAVEERTVFIGRHYVRYPVVFFRCAGRDLYWAGIEEARKHRFSSPAGPAIAEGDRISAVVPLDSPWRPANTLRPKGGERGKEVAVLVDHDAGRIYLPADGMARLNRVRRILGSFLALSFLFLFVALAGDDAILALPGFTVAGLAAFLLLLSELSYRPSLFSSAKPGFAESLDRAIHATGGFIGAPPSPPNRSRHAIVLWAAALAVIVFVSGAWIAALAIGAGWSSRPVAIAADMELQRHEEKRRPRVVRIRMKGEWHDKRIRIEARTEAQRRASAFMKQRMERYSMEAERFRRVRIRGEDLYIDPRGGEEFSVPFSKYAVRDTINDRIIYSDKELNPNLVGTGVAPLARGD